jgi:hypothetical protein
MAHALGGATQEMSQAIQSQLKADMQARGEHLTAEEAASVAPTINAVFAGVATLSAIGGLVIKGIFYGMIMIFLTRPHVREIFGEHPYANLPAQCRPC